MHSGSGHTTSLWMATADVPHHPPLADDAEADVCVVGAGIAGLTTAYLLAREGRRVLVLDDGPIGGGETSRTTAHLSFALDDRYHQLERVHGADGARLAADSHIAAVDRIERLVADEGIECDFERLDGYLFLAEGHEIERLQHELAAARHAGVPGVDLVARAPLVPFDTGPALRFPRQAQFHPMRYLAGLARALVERGGRIHSGTHASEIEGGTRCTVRTAEGRTVIAGAVVGRHELADQRLRRHARQAGAVPHLRRGRPCPERLDPHRALLGHRRSVPLRPAPARAARP